MKKKRLLRMIQDLEVDTERRTAAVMALAHKIKPQEGFRYNYIMYALQENFTAKEFYGIENFWRDVCRSKDAGTSKNDSMARRSILAKFDEQIPSRAGKLEEILRIDRLDGANGVFHALSRIVLDREEPLEVLDGSGEAGDGKEIKGCGQ